MAETAGGIYFPTKEDNFDLENDLPKLAESVDQKARCLYQESPVTRTATALGSFSTPLKLELPTVKANQLVEAFVAFEATSSISSTESAGGALRVSYNNNTGADELIGVLNGEPLAAASYVGGGSSSVGAARFVKLPLFSSTRDETGLLSAVRLVQSKDGPVSVELKGRCTGTGTVTVRHVWMMVRVTG